MINSILNKWIHQKDNSSNQNDLNQDMKYPDLDSH